MMNPTTTLIKTSPAATELISIIEIEGMAKSLKDVLIKEAILATGEGTCFEVMLTQHAAEESIPKALTEKLLGTWADFVKMMDEREAENFRGLLYYRYEHLDDVDEDEMYDLATAEGVVPCYDYLGGCDCAYEALEWTLLDMAKRYDLIERFKTASGYLTNDLLSRGW